MKITPVNNRILATRLENEKDPDAIESPGTSAELDKFMIVKVKKADAYKRGQLLVVPSYVDVFMDKTKELLIFHETDVVAEVEE